MRLMSEPRESVERLPLPHRPDMHCVCTMPVRGFATEFGRPEPRARHRPRFDGDQDSRERRAGGDFRCRNFRAVVTTAPVRQKSSFRGPRQSRVKTNVCSSLGRAHTSLPVAGRWMPERRASTSAEARSGDSPREGFSSR